MSTYRLNVVITVVLAMTFIAIHLTDGQADFQYGSAETRIDHPPGRKYCGKSLSLAVQKLCNGLYNTMFKKSDQDMDAAIPYDYPRPYWYIKSKKAANSMTDLGFRRQSRGIHDECCLKPCSIGELASYCAN